MIKTLYFSVVIPTFNEEDYLPRLLEDLSEQKERAFEVIVVDGRSTDKTRELAEKFKNSLPLHIEISPKSNVSFQRNLGAKLAKGKYLVFFDADVQLPKRFLQNVRYLLSNNLPDMATTYLRADSHNIYDRMIARVSSLALDIGKLLEKPCLYGFNFIIKRQTFITNTGFLEEIIHGEDCELSDRLYNLGYTLEIYKYPRLIYSLRRYREEGRLNVLQKNAKAALHMITKGHIKQNLFYYPMGGGWYKKSKQFKKETGFEKAEKYFLELIKSITE